LLHWESGCRQGSTSLDEFSSFHKGNMKVMKFWRSPYKIGLLIYKNSLTLTVLARFFTEK
jgi:hypothetical protein